MSSEFISMIIGLCVAVGIGTMLYAVYKKNSEHEIGVTLTRYLIKYPISIQMLLCIIFALAEAMLAATIHVEGEVANNPATRYVLHIGAAITSIVFAYNTPKQIFSLVYAMKDGLYGVAMASLLLFLMCIAGAWLIPLFNVLSVTNAANETPKLMILWYDFTGQDYKMISAIINHHYASPVEALGYNSWDNVSNVVVGSILSLTLHYAVMIWEVLQAFSDRRTREHYIEMFGREEKKEEKDKPKDKGKSKDEEAKDKPKDKPQAEKAGVQFKLALTFLGASEEDASRIAADESSKLETVLNDPATTNDMMQHVVSCMGRLSDLLHDSKDPVKKVEVSGKLRSLLESSLKNKKGFGFSSSSMNFKKKR